MRRMNYPRFDKPVNFGTYNEERDVFILDHEPEVGIYLIQIKDDGQIYSVICTFTENENTSACWYGVMWDDIVRIFYTPGDGNELGSGPHGGISAGATVEFYKLS